jgi:hypothetical protein
MNILQKHKQKEYQKQYRRDHGEKDQHRNSRFSYSKSYYLELLEQRPYAMRRYLNGLKFDREYRIDTNNN